MRQTWKVIFVFTALVLAFVLGMLADRSYLNRDLTPIDEVTQPETLVPVVRIISISNGFLKAEVEEGGEVRLKAGDNVAYFDENGIISLVLSDALEDYVSNPVPEGAVYVASVSGKKYYELGDSAVRRISPENRVYFMTALEAEELGYTLAE